MEQTIVNIAGGIILSGLGFLIQRVWSSLNDLQKRDEQLADKISHIEVMVARCYVTREETERLFTKVFDKLDRIDEKLNKHLTTGND